MSNGIRLAHQRGDCPGPDGNHGVDGPRTSGKYTAKELAELVKTATEKR